MSPGQATSFFYPCDIWWFGVGPCLGCGQQRNSTVSSVPAWFRVDSLSNLHTQPAGNAGIARTVSERPWIRIPIRPRSFSAPVTGRCSAIKCLGLRLSNKCSFFYPKNELLICLSCRAQQIKHYQVCPK